MRHLLRGLDFISLHPGPCLLPNPPLPHSFQAWDSGLPPGPGISVTKAELRASNTNQSKSWSLFCHQFTT